jgi:hypothetical protein
MEHQVNKPKAKIDNWAVVDSVSSPDFRELEPERRLTGTIFGHANLPNGVIYTSAIVSIDSANRLVETRNSVYELGEMSDDYGRWSRDHKHAA